MNKYLQQLVELAKFDKEIDGFMPRIESVEKVLRVAKQDFKDISCQIDKIDEDLDEIKTQKLKTNSHITEFSAKIKDVSKKGGSVKTDKEMKALNLEEEIAREQLEAANEEIARLEKIESMKLEQKSELQTKLSQIQQNLNDIETQISSELEAIEKERSEVYAKKDKLVSQINQKILTFYEKIRKWAGNSVVVPVKKQACYGCFMQINDKTFSSVIKGEDIITCPHCGRILYKETE